MKKLSEQEVCRRFDLMNLFLLEKYKNSSIKHQTRCKKCEYVWLIKPNDVFNRHGCPSCAGVRKLTDKEVEYILVENNIELISNYSNAYTLCKVRCLLCNCMWQNSITKIKFGRGCPSCAIEKRKQTNLKRYGCIAPAQNRKIALKAAKNSNNSYILHHWKTNEEIITVGSYEKKVVEFFNKNKVEYLWQPQVFELKKLKTTYRLDCFLIKQFLWIEIKGYFRKDAKEKWDVFCSAVPNCELWDKEKLEKLKII